MRRRSGRCCGRPDGCAPPASLRCSRPRAHSAWSCRRPLRAWRPGWPIEPIVRCSWRSRWSSMRMACCRTARPSSSSMRPRRGTCVHARSARAVGPCSRGGTANSACAWPGSPRSSAITHAPSSSCRPCMPRAPTRSSPRAWRASSERRVRATRPAPGSRARWRSTRCGRRSATRKSCGSCPRAATRKRSRLRARGSPHDPTASMPCGA